MDIAYTPEPIEALAATRRRSRVLTALRDSVTARGRVAAGVFAVALAAGASMCAVTFVLTFAIFWKLSEVIHPLVLSVFWAFLVLVFLASRSLRPKR